MLILRDAKGAITGYTRQKVVTAIAPDPIPGIFGEKSSVVAPGGFHKFAVSVDQWGTPVTKVEAFATVSTPP